MVHLRAVRLRGFKTFAKPTELAFEPGVTVIIGPNGSGKSNIADAVLWVLGEQSPGNLRGRTMQDVMYSGAGGRKASAVAEVTLVFDNGSGSLPLDCAELEVTRRLSRDTGSEYRLNGSECRLLDVQDLVGALGLGREMHSVISQGKVEALLNSSPEARRAMVEEAAGLGRYKKRRERARAKLERTAQNLLRVADIEGEVKAALRPLKQQVVAAERFAEATEAWALASARSIMYALVEARASCDKTGGELDSTQAGLATVGGKISELRRQRAAEEEHFTRALEERERLGAAYHRARAEAEYLEGRAASLRQRLARMEGELDRARRRRDLAGSEAASLAERVEKVMVETADEIRLARVGGWAEVLRDALDESLPAYRADLAAEDDLKDSVFELEAARSRALQDRDFLRREIDERGRVCKELSGLADEARARLERLGADAVGSDEAAAEAEESVRSAETGLKESISARELARARVEEASRSEAAIAEQLAGMEARRAVLEDILTRKEGMPPGARELMETDRSCRPLTEVLTVRPGYERAVTAALGPLAQALVVPGGYGLARALEGSGALEVVEEAPARQAGGTSATGSPAATADGSGGGGLPAGTCDLFEIVSGPAAVIESLQRLVPATAVVVDDRRPDEIEAGEAEGESGARWCVVTRSGEMLRRGVHAARRLEVGAESLLAARNELESVRTGTESLLLERATVREEAEQAATEVGRAEEWFKRQEERLHQAERTLAGQKSERDLLERRIEEGRAQLVELQGRREREDGLAEQMAAELRTVEEAMAGGEAQLDEARSSLRTLQGRLETARRTVGRLEEKKGQATLLEVKLRERCRAHTSERSRAQHQREVADDELARCVRRLERLERYIPVMGELLRVAEGLAGRSRGVATRFEAEVEATRTRTEGTAREMRDWGSAEVDLQREYEDMSARLTQARVDQARLEDRRVQLEGELAELRRRHLSPRGVTPEDVAGEDEEALATSVARAERRRERIGPVNPLAEQECAEMAERARFLAEQMADLEAALAELHEVISGLDEHIERSFNEIFESAREHFSSVIASVFPGAKGSLRLTEGKPRVRPVSEGESEASEEGLEEEEQQAAGIALEVKFPNKSPRSLSLLSGGEKAMTAIAFLFSLFLARPCPFYILDEVEASLDDINIRRFLSLVRKYRDKTQFIVITHQRQTMEVADTLYGVALESDGTSRVLSRRLATAKGA